MVKLKAATSVLAVSAMLVLSGCGEDQAVVASEPETPAARPAETVEQQDRGNDLVDQLREGAEGLAGEARRLADEAGRALEDPGPLLDQASELAGRIGQSVDEIVQQAAEDLQRGVEMLEQRIAEMSGEPVIVEGTDARLAPEASLNADTSAAARAVRAGVGPDYIGVWTDTAENCGRIDQGYVERFAVITPTTIRHAESVCNFEARPMEGNEVTLAAECVAEGDFEERRITLTMNGFETLRISYDNHSGAEFLRCHLPE